MTKQFTTDHYNHLKEKGFRPDFCEECQEIDSILLELKDNTPLEQEVAVLRRMISGHIENHD